MGPRASRCFGGRDAPVSAGNPSRLKVGDRVPSVDVLTGDPPQSVNFADLCRGKTVVLIGMCGAFTPV